MWALFGRFAAEYGYTPYRNTDCSGNNAYEPIRMVNVGPQGEYNRLGRTPLYSREITNNIYCIMYVCMYVCT